MELATVVADERRDTHGRRAVQAPDAPDPTSSPWASPRSTCRRRLARRPAVTCTSTTSEPRPTRPAAHLAVRRREQRDPPRPRSPHRRLADGGGRAAAALAGGGDHPRHRRALRVVRGSAASTGSSRTPRRACSRLAWVLFAASVIPSYAWFRQALTTMLPLGADPPGGQPDARPRAQRAAPALAAGGRVPRARPDVHRAGTGRALRRARGPARRARRTARLRPAPAGPRCGDARPRTCCSTSSSSSPTPRARYDNGRGANRACSTPCQKLGRWVLADLLPSFIGGPVVWRSGNGPYSFASTPLGLVVAAAALLALLLALARAHPGEPASCRPGGTGAARHTRSRCSS